MTSSQLKLYLSLGVVVSHILIFFGVLSLRALVIPDANVLEIIGSMTPIFGVFLIVIVKDTLRRREDLSKGKRQSPQMIAITFLILSSYFLAAILTLLMVVQQSISIHDLPKWLIAIESAFGVALGLIIDDVFGGQRT